MYLVLFIIVSVLWSTSSSLSTKFIEEENETLKALSQEVQTDKLIKLWLKSENLKGFKSKDLNEAYRLKGILNEGEIRILICYCTDSKKFYKDLNEDLRERGGRKYPEVTKVLKSAIYKLMKYRSPPTELYRNEDASLLPMFRAIHKTKSKTGMLKQFTSTSTDYVTAKNFDKGVNRMIIKYEDMKVGAYVADFSPYNESEVLLPVSAVYTVKEVDVNSHFDVLLTGPRMFYTSSTSDNRNNVGNFNSNVFIIFVSVLMVNFA